MRVAWHNSCQMALLVASPVTPAATHAGRRADRREAFRFAEMAARPPRLEYVSTKLRDQRDGGRAPPRAVVHSVTTGGALDAPGHLARPVIVQSIARSELEHSVVHDHPQLAEVDVDEDITRPT